MPNSYQIFSLCCRCVCFLLRMYQLPCYGEGFCVGKKTKQYWVLFFKVILKAKSLKCCMMTASMKHVFSLFLCVSKRGAHPSCFLFALLSFTHCWCWCPPVRHPQARTACPALQTGTHLPWNEPSPAATCSQISFLLPPSPPSASSTSGSARSSASLLPHPAARRPSLWGISEASSRFVGNDFALFSL